MFDSGGSGPDLEAEAAARWMLRAAGTDSPLAARLCDAGAVVLVLDAAGERVLHASEAARDLRQAIAGPDGRLVPGSRIGEQIARTQSRPDAPLLMRLHLDPRRVAPPALVTLVRSETEDGRGIVILLATGPLPRLRRPSSASAPPATATAVSDVLPADTDVARDAPAAPQDVAPASADAAPIPTARQRFTWRSGADGTVSDLSRPPGDPLRERMLGRSWQVLSEIGVLRDAEGLIAALSQSRTFRAIPVTLLAADGTVIELELSGSPTERGGREFRGFGQVRAVSPPKEETAPPAVTASPVVIEARPGPVEAAVPVLEGVPEPLPPDAAEAESSQAESSDVDVPEAAPAASSIDATLSSHEHAAFREIARALGARFAGDDGRAEPQERGLPCAVMPFPVPAARTPDPGTTLPDAAMVATLERLPAGVLVYRENRILFANRRLLDLTGHADVEALDSAGGIERLFRGLLPHARESGDTPVVLAGRDGGRLSALIEHSVLDWAGQPAELLLARDAEPSETVRADAAAAIAQGLADRRAVDALGVLDSLEDGIATLDAQARILTLNRSAAALFGLDPREVVGASFLGLFAHENAVDLLARLHAEPGAAPLAPARVVARATGAALRVKVLPLSEDPQNRLCAVIDASPGSRREEEASDGRRVAEAANLQKSDFLAQVSHEIRTPINGILGFADLMINEQFGPLGSERYRSYLQDIHASGTHVLDLVNDLLDLARIEAGRLDLTLTEIPLNDVVARCVSLLQPQAARERIVLRTSFSSELAPLMADERSVRQAALNVIANAIAFTEAGGQVIVSTMMAERGEIALRVRDTGIGMTADEVEVALQPFRQVRPVGPRKGTGLGLPLTKALVEANHGRFRISSRKDDGTLVEMLFPVDAATRRA
ncbi:PAS domain-containing sensor histidine kinase [Methylobacterium sp. J-068]|uniref:PAS domain-containing sensor histidine kinase n=1 Tax=Methylobacterium sp. J-068 TaxID=2836649 RepID=UPI001FB9A849|nr:PAS domain-containing sensor histidine kinase [Methylobacterium sp. J-068]MCJ2034633.1 ATP-binding protein [Methylobacterium sp. J-068]